MKDIKKILRFLESQNFRITYNDGTRRKIYPPNHAMPFYSLHVGENAVKPLIRFARNNWSIDLTQI